MLSIFPELLFLSTFSALALRVALAIILGLTAWRHASGMSGLARVYAFAEVIVAAALVAGAWTQPAALAGALWLAASLFFSEMRVFSKSTIALAIVIALSLVVTGPGAFAFDLPL